MLAIKWGGGKSTCAVLSLREKDVYLCIPQEKKI